MWPYVIQVLWLHVTCWLSQFTFESLHVPYGPLWELEPGPNELTPRPDSDIDKCYHFIQEVAQNRALQLIYCPTDDMAADILTKALPKWKATFHTSTLRLCTHAWGGVMDCGLEHFVGWLTLMMCMFHLSSSSLTFCSLSASVLSKASSSYFLSPQFALSAQGCKRGRNYVLFFFLFLYDIVHHDVSVILFWRLLLLYKFEISVLVFC